jgi:hypothetical protein
MKQRNQFLYFLCGLVICIALSACDVKESKAEVKTFLNYSEGASYAGDNGLDIFLIVDLWASSSHRTSELLNDPTFIEKSRKYSVIIVHADDASYKENGMGEMPDVVYEIIESKITPQYVVINTKGHIIRGPMGFSSTNNIIKLLE